MAKDPFPFCRAALVRVLRAPLISRGLKAEKDTKRFDRPSSDIWVRSGRVGMAPGMLVAVAVGGAEDVGLGSGVAEYVNDILLEGEIECVDLPVGLMTVRLTVSDGRVVLVCVCVCEPEADPVTEGELLAEGEPLAEGELLTEGDPVTDPEPLTDPEAVADPEPLTDPDPLTDPEAVTDPEELVECEVLTETDPLTEPEPDVDPVTEPEPVPDPEEEKAAVAEPCTVLPVLAVTLIVLLVDRLTVEQAVLLTVRVTDIVPVEHPV